MAIAELAITRDSSRWSAAWGRYVAAFRGLPPIVVDGGLAIILIVLGWVQVFGTLPSLGLLSEPDQALQAALLAGAIVPVLVSRQWPVAALLVTAGVVGVAGTIGPLLTVNLGPAAAFTLYFLAYRVVAGETLGRGLSAILIATVAQSLVLRPWSGELSVEAWLPNYPWIAAAFLAGRAQRERTELAAVLQRHTIAVEQDRRAQQLVIDQARADLAADLRDVVARTLGLMVSAARRALRQLQTHRSPDSALRELEALGRAALGDLRLLLEVLRRAERATDSDPPSAQGPKIAPLRGLPPPATFDAVTDERLRDVSRATEVVASRIIHEAVELQRREGEGARPAVRLTFESDAVLVSIDVGVADDGPMSRVRRNIALAGIRAWAASIGGRLDVAGSSGRHLRISARLPSTPRFEPSPATVGTDTNGQRRSAVGRPLLWLPEAVTAIARRARWLDWPVDLALVAVLAIGGVLEMRYWSGVLGLQVPAQTFSFGAYAWVVASNALLLGRRIAPMATVIAMAVAAFLGTFPLGFWTPVSSIWGLMISVYAVAERYPWRPHAPVAALLCAAGLVSIQPISTQYAAFLGIMAVNLLGAAYVGTILGERERLNRELERRLVALMEERRLEVAVAFGRDRMMLARELHDLVAHSLSIMVVQSGAARTVAAVDRDGARRAVDTAISVAKRAEAELADLLTLLRGPGAEFPPVAGEVAALVDEARNSGMTVTLRRVGDPVPAGGGAIEANVYRIVQEALTNARKHAPGSAVDIELAYRPDEISLRVNNAAPSAPPAAGSGGMGLAGMRERAIAFGGRFEAHGTLEGGFRVHAVFPRRA